MNDRTYYRIIVSYLIYYELIWLMNDSPIDRTYYRIIVIGYLIYYELIWLMNDSLIDRTRWMIELIIEL